MTQQPTLFVSRLTRAGKTGVLYKSYKRGDMHVTSEFNSHLAVHNDQIRTTKHQFSMLLFMHSRSI